MARASNSRDFVFIDVPDSEDDQSATQLVADCGDSSELSANASPRSDQRETPTQLLKATTTWISDEEDASHAASFVNPFERNSIGSSRANSGEGIRAERQSRSETERSCISLSYSVGPAPSSSGAGNNSIRSPLSPGKSLELPDADGASVNRLSKRSLPEHAQDENAHDANKEVSRPSDGGSLGWVDGNAARMHLDETEEQGPAPSRRKGGYAAVATEEESPTRGVTARRQSGAEAEIQEQTTQGRRSFPLSPSESPGLRGRGERRGVGAEGWRRQMETSPLESPPVGARSFESEGRIMLVRETSSQQSLVIPWMLYAVALALKVVGGLCLLGVVLATLSTLGDAVTCPRTDEPCLDRGGILAYPVLLHETTGFSYGVSSYFATTAFLLLGLIGVLVPLSTSAYFSLQVLRHRTATSFYASLRAVSFATPPLSAFVMAFLAPVFFSQKFCFYEDLDLNAPLRPIDSPIPSACKRLCDAFPMTVACLVTSAICLVSMGLLLFQKYSRLWAASLSASLFKVVSAGALLQLAVMFSVEGREILLETYDLPRPEVQGLDSAEGLSKATQLQMGLLFSTLQGGVYTLAFGNLAAGVFAFTGSYFRSQLFSLLNVLVNFSFMFINAACFCGMSFEYATLELACNFQEYPLGNNARAEAEARLVCKIKPQFLVAWIVVLSLAFVDVADLVIGLAIFKNGLCDESTDRELQHQKTSR